MEQDNVEFDDMEQLVQEKAQIFDKELADIFSRKCKPKIFIRQFIESKN